MESGDLDAVILAAAGLVRLNREAAITEYLEPAQMLPAPGQDRWRLKPQTRSHSEIRICTKHCPTSMISLLTLQSTLNEQCSMPLKQGARRRSVRWQP